MSIAKPAATGFAPSEPSPGPKAQAVIAQRERRLVILGLFPILLWQTIFFVIPMLILLVYSFWTMHDYRLDYNFTLANYVEIFTSPIYLKAFLLSLQIALFVTA